MAKSSKKQKGTPLLELLLAAPATPRVVEDAAHLFGRMLHAASPNLSNESVTLTVSNFEAKVTLNGYSPEGKRAGKKISACLSRPKPAIEKSAESRGIAACLIEDSRSLIKHQPIFQRPGTKKEVAKITDTYVQRLQSFVSGAPKIGLRGTTTIVSPVLRVGRTTLERQIHARILIDGFPYEVPVEKSKVGALYDESKLGATRRIKLDVQWTPDSSGAMKIDPTSAKIVGIDQLWSPASAKEALAAIEQGSGDLFDDALGLLADIEGN